MYRYLSRNIHHVKGRYFASMDVKDGYNGKITRVGLSFVTDLYESKGYKLVEVVFNDNFSGYYTSRFQNYMEVNTLVKASTSNFISFKQMICLFFIFYFIGPLRFAYLYESINSERLACRNMKLNIFHSLLFKTLKLLNSLRFQWLDLIRWRRL